MATTERRPRTARRGLPLALAFALAAAVALTGCLTPPKPKTPVEQALAERDQAQRDALRPFTGPPRYTASDLFRATAFYRLEEFVGPDGRHAAGAGDPMAVFRGFVLDKSERLSVPLSDTHIGMELWRKHQIDRDVGGFTINTGQLRCSYARQNAAAKGLVSHGVSVRYWVSGQRLTLNERLLRTLDEAHFMLGRGRETELPLVDAELAQCPPTLADVLLREQRPRFLAELQQQIKLHVDEPARVAAAAAAAAEQARRAAEAEQAAQRRQAVLREKARTQPAPTAEEIAVLMNYRSSDRTASAFRGDRDVVWTVRLDGANGYSVEAAQLFKRVKTDHLQVQVTNLRCQRIAQGQRCRYTETLVWNDLLRGGVTRSPQAVSRDFEWKEDGLTTRDWEAGQPAIPGIGPGSGSSSSNSNRNDAKALEERMRMREYIRQRSEAERRQR